MTNPIRACRIGIVVAMAVGVCALVAGAAPSPAHLPATTAATVTRTPCTSPTYTTTNPEGTKSFTSGLYWTNNDAWNGTHATQTLKVCSPSSWSASIDQPTKSGQVETYPDTEYDVGGRTHLNTTKAVATFTNITSSFAETNPTTSGNNWDAGYDLWTTNWGKETMIWNQWMGGQNYWYTQATKTATLGGVAYKFYAIGTCSSKCERIFFRVNQVSTGSVNIEDAFKWEVANGYLPATAKPTQLEYGVEICGTVGTETFPTTGLTMTVNGGGTPPSTPPKTTKPATPPKTTPPKTTTPPPTTPPKSGTGADTLRWTKVHNNEQTTGATATVVTATLGDLVIAESHLEPSSAEHFTGISDSNHRVTWDETPLTEITGAAASNNTEAIYIGRVLSAGATKITTTHSGTNSFDGFVIAQEWHSTTYGSSAKWFGVTASFVERSGTAKTVDFPPLKSGTAGSIYFGWSYPASTGQIPSTRQGFTWKITDTGQPNATNILVYKGTLAANTTYAPKGEQVSSGAYYDGTAAIVAATGSGGTPPKTPPKSTTPPPPPPPPATVTVSCSGTYASSFRLDCSGPPAGTPHQPLTCSGKVGAAATFTMKCKL